MDIYTELIAFYGPKHSYESFDDYTFRKKGMTTFEYLYSLGPVAEASAAWYRAAQTLTGSFLPLPDRSESQRYRENTQVAPDMYEPRTRLPRTFEMIRGPGGVPVRVNLPQAPARPTRPIQELPPVSPSQYASLMALYTGVEEQSPALRLQQTANLVPPELVLERLSTEDLLMSVFGLQTIASSPLLQQMRLPLLYNTTNSTFLVSTAGGLVNVGSSDASFEILKALGSRLTYSTLGPVVVSPKLMSLERECGSLVIRYGPSKFKVSCDLLAVIAPMVSAAFASQGLDFAGLASYQF
jgi:hypothetical protein